MIALCIGGARCVWDDLRAAKALMGDRPYLVIACNYAGARYPERLDGWASLHPEMVALWRRKRARIAPDKVRTFSPKRHPDAPGIKTVRDRFHGSSGLYMAQVAIQQFKASGVILCGVPMDNEAGHIAIPGRWEGAGRYRTGFEAAVPVFGSRLRSMGGWTADLLGRPDPEWIDAKA